MYGMLLPKQEKGHTHKQRPVVPSGKYFWLSQPRGGAESPAEVRDDAKRPVTHPQQRVTQPKTSMVPRLRNPGLWSVWIISKRTLKRCLLEGRWRQKGWGKSAASFSGSTPLRAVFELRGICDPAPCTCHQFGSNTYKNSKKIISIFYF